LSIEVEALAKTNKTLEEKVNNQEDLLGYKK
jgi:hypothetical protein